MPINHAQGLLLAQLVPGVVTPVLAFTASLRTEITLITAAVDPVGGPATVNVALYHDDIGSGTFNKTTLIRSFTLPQFSGDNKLFQAQHPGSGIILTAGGQIAVQSASANNVTFSIYGITETIAERVLARQ